MSLWLCGFGAFFIVQFIKTLSPLPLGQRSGVVLALISSVGIAFILFRARFGDVAAYGLAGAGLLISIDGVVRYLSVAGDWYRRQIMNNRPRG